MHQHRTVQVLFAALILAISPVIGGTISIAWNPVAGSDVVGYRVFRGTAAGNFSQHQDVGLVTSSTISNLAACTQYHLAVKARTASGVLSESFSNSITGFPKPEVTSVTPTTAERGLGLSMIIRGANFMNGATVRFGNPNITVSSVTVDSCTQITASVIIGPTAASGASTIAVRNPDGVLGSIDALFTVTATVRPVVSSVVPANAATRVPVGVRPTLIFNEPMDALTINATTVMLLDAFGRSVAQAPGSPGLAADRVTVVIVPAAMLAPDETYRVRVQGGPTGVKDLAHHAMALNFVQTEGFMTAPDSDAPTISSVTVFAEATTAEIIWTTNEPADAQVFYRKASDVSYQRTKGYPTAETHHSVVLQGLSPATVYFFRVRSGDEDGRSTSTPDRTFTTDASPYEYLRIEAESGLNSPPVQMTSGVGAFRGAWIETPPDAPVGSASAPTGSADFEFWVPTAGVWRVWARIDSPDASGDAWFESIDHAPPQPLPPSWTGAWSWVGGLSHSLARGLHHLELGGGEPGARADRLLITNDPTFVPTEQPIDDTTAPEAPADLAASTTLLSTTLTWTNPAWDVDEVVVRFRTDGLYPMSPMDGLPALVRGVTVSSDESFTHLGLNIGVTYSYSVFSVDASGNASDPAQIRVTPRVGG